MQLATKIITGLGVAAFIAGCGRAPESLAQQAARARPEPTEVVTEAAGTSLPLSSAPSTPADASSVEASASPLVQFKNPQTQAAVADYQAKWQQLQNDQESAENLDTIDPLVNPQAITDYANQIGAHANQLDQAERAAKGLMDPNDKKRFKALQKQLQEEQAEE